MPKIGIVCSTHVVLPNYSGTQVLTDMTSSVIMMCTIFHINCCGRYDTWPDALLDRVNRQHCAATSIKLLCLIIAAHKYNHVLDIKSLIVFGVLHVSIVKGKQGGKIPINKRQVFLRKGTCIAKSCTMPQMACL